MSVFGIGCYHQHCDYHDGAPAPMSQSGNYEAMFGVCYVIRYSLPNAQTKGHTYAEDKIYESISLQKIILVVSNCMSFKQRHIFATV